MNQDEYIALMYKKLKSDISTKELDIIDRYILADEKHAKLFEEIRQSWNEQEAPFAIDSTSEFNRLKTRITNPQQQKSKVRFLNWTRIAVAAGLLLLAGIFVWQQNQSISYNEFSAVDIAKEITLKDGSKVWVNKGSKISVPSNYNQDNRQIKLDGEAYFDVQKNEKLAFEIDANEIIVTVLGTAFNVKESDNSIQVMVDRGKVKVEELNGNEEKILEANQSATYDKANNNFSDNSSFNANALYWKTGRLRFSEQSFSSAMSEIGSIFDKEITIENVAFAECEISGSFGGKDLNALLSSLAKQFKFEYRIEEQRVFITGGVCG